MKKAAFYLLGVLFLASCQKEDTTPASNYNLVFKFKFDSTQARLNSIGMPSTIPAGNAGQSPVFNKMSAHYIELAQTATTLLGSGAVLYKAPETLAGGATAIDFSKSTLAANGEVFFTIPLNQVANGNYEWLRVSLAYQNYDVKYRIDTTISTPGGPLNINQENTGTVSSFIGFNSYLTSYQINTKSVIVNGNRKQGYWGFESTYSLPFVGSRTDTATGQAPENATTVVNPIQSTSPIPAGSCVVTAAFQPGKLSITGNETKDIVVEVSLSTNKSFEWKEVVANGKWDPAKNEKIVDMGIRGMKPTWQ